MLNGRCLCGAVRYAYQGGSKTLTICHCGMCRRWHGALGAYLCGKAADYRVEGVEHIRWFKSSSDAERGFCGQCGSKLFWRSGEGMDVAAGILDQPTGLSTTAHIWVAHKGDYYAIDDDAPQFAESPSGEGPRRVTADPTPQMPVEQLEHHGRCLCGAIDFKVSGRMRDVVWCHCGQCLHWHGHFAGYTASRWDSVAMTGEERLAWHQSSVQARRGYCRQCGSNLFWEPAHRRHVSISAGALDLPTGLVTAKHIFTEHKADYYALGSSTPVLPGSMSANPVTF